MNSIINYMVLLVAILSVVYGYQFKFKHNVKLISKYDETKVKDKDGLTTWMGNHYFVLSVVLFFLTGKLFFVSVEPDLYTLLIVSAYAIVFVRMMVGAKKFYK
jgi:hypothetical protein